MNETLLAKLEGICRNYGIDPYGFAMRELRDELGNESNYALYESGYQAAIVDMLMLFQEVTKIPAFKHHNTTE